MWAAIIIAVTLLGRWAFSVDTYAQEGGGPTPTVTPTTLGEEGDSDGDKEKREELPDCSDSGNAGYPECWTHTPAPTSTPRPTSTPKPTLTPRPTKTPTPVTGPPIPFVPTEVPCPPGWTRGPCYAPGGTWTPTPTHTPTNPPTPTSTPTQVLCPRGIVKCQPPPRPTLPDTLTGTRSPTPTFTPTPTGTRSPTPTVTDRNVDLSSLFSATVDRHGNPIHDGSRSQWHIFDYDLVRVFITARSNTTNIAGYKFRLNLNPGGTGFYMADYGDTSCDPDDLGSDKTNWVSGPEMHTLIVRCGLGRNANAGFLVQGRVEETLEEFTVATTGRIPQAWHQESRSVTYELDLATLTGRRPSYIYRNYYDGNRQKEVEDSVKSAVDWLNVKLRPNVFSPTTAPNVVVKGFWYGSGECSGAPACMRRAGDRTDFGPYPHFGPLEIWIRVPADVDDSLMSRKIINWTDKGFIVLDDRFGHLYLFLPWVAAHELVHTIGPNHLPQDDHLMAPEGGNRVLSELYMSASDSAGAMESIRQHGHGGR